MTQGEAQKDQTVVATGHGVRVEISPDGNVIVHTDGQVETRPADPALKRSAPSLDWPTNPLTASLEQILAQRAAPPDKLDIVLPPPAPLPSSPSSYEVGQNIPGKGIYAGRWQPRDRGGQSLNVVFNLFAAPEDMQNKYKERVRLDYTEAFHEVAKLRNWHGHDGSNNILNDTALYAAIRDGRHHELSRWFVPTSDILRILYDQKNAGSFARTFDTKTGIIYAPWYWSCTRRDRHDGEIFYYLRFSDGDDDFGSPSLGLAVRPVRAELRL